MALCHGVPISNNCPDMPAKEKNTTMQCKLQWVVVLAPEFNELERIRGSMMWNTRSFAMPRVRIVRMAL